MSLSPEAFFNFAVIKRSKQGRGKDQHRIISFDFKNKQMHTINKERITKTFDFDDMYKYDKAGLYVEVHFKTKSQVYACTFQSKDDCEMFVDLVDAQVNQRTFDPSKYDRTVLARGHVLKYKSGMFQRRFLVLVPGKLFVFGPKVGSASRWQYPRNILALDSTSYSELDDDVSFNLRYGAQGEERIGFLTSSRAERTSWIKSLVTGSRRKAKPKEDEEKDEASATPAPADVKDEPDDSDDDSNEDEAGVVEEPGAAEGTRIRVASLVDLTSDDPTPPAQVSASQATPTNEETAPSNWVSFGDDNGGFGNDDWADFGQSSGPPATAGTNGNPAPAPAAPAPAPAANNPFVQATQDPAVSPRGPTKSEADWVSFEMVSPPRPAHQQPAKPAPVAQPGQNLAPFDLLYPMRASSGNPQEVFGQANLVPVDLTKTNVGDGHAGNLSKTESSKQFELYKEMDAKALYTTLGAH